MQVRTLLLYLAFTVPSCLASWNATSSTITNNVPWTDENGKNIKANRKAKISEQIGEYRYLVGSKSKPECAEEDTEEEKRAGDIFIYKSKTLGSNSWEFVQKIKEKSASNCQMNVYRKDKSEDKIYLHCRTLVCVSTNGPDGDYKCSNWGNSLPNNDTRKVGDASTFRDGESLYFVATRKNRNPQKKPGVKPERKVSIHKFKDGDWTKIEKEPVATWANDHREAPYIVKRNDRYYVFTSMTARWQNSRTTYMQSNSLKGFSNKKMETDEKEVVMHPPDTRAIKSMGTQFAGILDFGDGKLFFSGVRHPVEDPCNFAKEFGSHVMTSFQFDQNGVPHVYWKESFDWKSPDYKPTDFEKYREKNYSPKCEDTKTSLSLPGIRKKNCAHVKTDRKKRELCKREDVAKKCPTTCLFYCKAKFCDKDRRKKTHLKSCP